MENRKRAGGQDEDKKTVEDVYREYTKRRMAIVRALTTDFQDFHRQCDPDKRENLCLYGLPTGEWEVNEPGKEAPPKLPEPILGINVARDALDKKDWICQVAIHSDSWLIAIVSFLGAKFRFDKYDRKHLFALMNEFPTVYEVVNGKVEPNPTGSSQKSMGKSGASESKEKQKNSEEAECGACRGSYEGDEFWICCDICERWFHGKCVDITPSTAETIEQYKCPTCSRHRP